MPPASLHRQNPAGHTQIPFWHTSPSGHSVSEVQCPMQWPFTHRSPAGQHVLPQGVVLGGQSWQVVPPAQIWPALQQPPPQANWPLGHPGSTHRPPEQISQVSQQAPSQQVRFRGQQPLPQGAAPRWQG